MATQPLFKWRHFEAEIILLCVRWYVRYPLSYWDLEEMMAERGRQVDHTHTHQAKKQESYNLTTTDRYSRC